MTTTATLRFQLRHDIDSLEQVDMALAACPGSAPHIAAARAARRRNRERGRNEFIPGCGAESDIDQWESQGIEWRVIQDHVEVFTGAHPEVHVTASLTSEQSAWLADHLLLDEADADPGTGGTCWTVEGGAWRDEHGRTPFEAVLIDVHEE